MCQVNSIFTLKMKVYRFVETIGKSAVGLFIYILSSIYNVSLLNFTKFVVNLGMYIGCDLLIIPIPQLYSGLESVHKNTKHPIYSG